MCRFQIPLYYLISTSCLSLNMNRMLPFADTHTRSTVPYHSVSSNSVIRSALSKRLEIRHDLAALGGHLGFLGHGFVKLLDFHACHVFLLIRRWPHERESCLSLTCHYELNQFFSIVKFIIVTIDSITMIYDSILFISLQAFQEFVFSVSFDKQAKSIRFYFLKYPFLADFFAFIAMAQLFLQ